MHRRPNPGMIAACDRYTAPRTATHRHAPPHTSTHRHTRHTRHDTATGRYRGIRNAGEPEVRPSRLPNHPGQVRDS